MILCGVSYAVLCQSCCVMICCCPAIISAIMFALTLVAK